MKYECLFCLCRIKRKLNPCIILLLVGRTKSDKALLENTSKTKKQDIDLFKYIAVDSFHGDLFGDLKDVLMMNVNSAI